ncbi:MAG: nucleotide 5'-monophosphate nucleosidase PpnN [Methylococcales bacterium]|nr:nucleotide 5'-monophosphate nucleosidase PpnN [Methylococcales bacterium]
MKNHTVDAIIAPEGPLALLSQGEVAQLLDHSQSGLYQTLHHCALAVLNCGNSLDDGKELLARYPDFNIALLTEARGLKLAVTGAPASAFVDGEMIKGIKEHLFALLRDLLYVHDEIVANPKFDLNDSSGITNAVFHLLRNARVIHPQTEPRLVVCWGGHSISREEYDYSKELGYELGLRGLNICTGCGPGAMKGPMKGATIGHAKQRIDNGHYIGITEPGIIAAESPNPIVNDLVILPDIEKRLEAFVRIAHGIIVFPGGVGTLEEILYLLGILLHPDNAELPFSLLFTGPACARDYFAQVDAFIGATLGVEAQQRYQIIIDDPELVARRLKEGIQQVRAVRKQRNDAYCFNWSLTIPAIFQQPFQPNHANMRALSLHLAQPVHELAAHLRRVFSGIVAGNVKEQGIRAIEQHGLFEIHGEAGIMEPVDALLTAFIEQNRMKLPGKVYVPCYRLIHR